MRLSFGVQPVLRLLNWLAQENRRILIQQPDLPGLYDSGVVYRREAEETWCDYLLMLAQGWEDCDGLSAARAGEIMARGAAALQPGDQGFAEARRLAPGTPIKAGVYMTTRVPRGATGLYHCVTRYQIGNTIYRDDPSARLGMHDGRIRNA